jgi:hypothetical protein
MIPDLKAAIEASLREANAPKPSAPTGLETPRAEGPSPSNTGSAYPQSYFPVSRPLSQLYRLFQIMTLPRWSLTRS